MPQRWSGPRICRTILLVSGACVVGFRGPEVRSQPLATGQPKFVGNVIRNGFSIRPDFSQYWNQVTAENAGKWGSVQSGSGAYNWAPLDTIYRYALARGFPYRHHTLIWGQQQPAFLNTLDSAAQYLEIERWIRDSGERYPEADFCDVVNEPLHAPPAYKNALGGDGVTGWDWVIRAFELARQHWSPHTELHINEYSVINDGTANARYIAIINLLKDRGLIDGIGVQGHGFEVDGGASVTTLVTNLNNLAATGLPIYITEFDINQPVDSVQLQRYRTIFPALYGHPGVAGMTLWGYVQYEIWQVNAYLITDRLAKRPAFLWLQTYLATPLPPVLISPLGSTDEPRDALLQWRSSALADSYRVQVSLDRLFAMVTVDTSIADTVIRIPPQAAQTRLYWHVRASNTTAESEYAPAATFVTGDEVVVVSDPAFVPSRYVLEQNHPNPFNPSTQIAYSIPEKTHVSLKVYSVLGTEVAMLVDGVENAGRHVVTFNGGGHANGLYLYRLQTGGFTATKKAVLLK